MTAERLECTFKSPIGMITLEQAGDAIEGLHIDKYAESGATTKTSELLEEAQMQIAEYFAGKRREFTLPLHTNGTAFEEEVWRVIASVRYGETISYGEIARRIGRKKAVRAVGGACGENPIPILIPCHRVLQSDGGIGGFALGIDAKRLLLGLEGTDV